MRRREAVCGKDSKYARMRPRISPGASCSSVGDGGSIASSRVEERARDLRVTLCVFGSATGVGGLEVDAVAFVPDAE